MQSDTGLLAALNLGQLLVQHSQEPPHAAIAGELLLGCIDELGAAVQAAARWTQTLGHSRPAVDADAVEADLVALGEGKREALTRLVAGDSTLPATGLPGLVVCTDLENIE